MTRTPPRQRSLHRLAGSTTAALLIFALIGIAPATAAARDNRADHDSRYDNNSHSDSRYGYHFDFEPGEGLHLHYGPKAYGRHDNSTSYRADRDRDGGGGGWYICKRYASYRECQPGPN